MALEAEGAIGRKDELSRAVYDASMALAAQGSALQDAERRAYELKESRFKEQLPGAVRWLLPTVYP